MQFDFDGARKAGYTDDEIVDHVRSQKDSGFDVDAAKKAGYSSTELVEHLKTRAAAKPAVAGEPASPRAGEPAAPRQPRQPAEPAPMGNLSDMEGTGVQEIQTRDPKAIRARGSVMDGFVPPEPTKPLIEQRGAPVTRETRAAVERGMQRVSPAGREVLTSRPDWVGGVSRAVASDFAAADETAARLPTAGKTIKEATGRIEDRAAGIASRTGLDSRYTENAAAIDIEAGRMPGDSSVAGGVDVSTMDFERRRELAEANPVSRGLGKGVTMLGAQGSGLIELLADSVGANNIAAGRRERGRQYESLIADYGDPEAQTGMLRNFEGALSSIVSNAPGLVIGTITGGSALPLMLMGAQTLGDEYSSGRRRGLDYQDALARGAIFGAAEVIGESFGIGAFLKAARGAFGDMPTDMIVKELAKSMAREIPGEQLTTAIQSGTDKFAPFGLTPELTLEQYLGQVADTLVQTVMQTGIQSGGVMAGAKAIRALRDNRKAAPSANPGFGTPADLQRVLDDPRPLEEIRAADAQAGAQATAATAPPATPPVVEPQPQGPVTIEGDGTVVDGSGQADLDAALRDLGEVMGTGERDSPVIAAKPEHIDAAAAQIDREATPAQHEAGNAKKGHFQFPDGHPLKGVGVVTLETARGDTRVATDGSWESPPMPAHYGYLRDYPGADGDKLDVFVGDNLQSNQIFLIDQIREDGSFDETKSMIGFATQAEAIDAYIGSYSNDATQLIGQVSTLSLKQFSNWVKSGKTKKAFAYKQEKANVPAEEKTAVESKGQAPTEPVSVQKAGTGNAARQPDNELPRQEVGNDPADWWQKQTPAERLKIAEGAYLGEAGYTKAVAGMEWGEMDDGERRRILAAVKGEPIKGKLIPKRGADGSVQWTTMPVEPVKPNREVITPAEDTVIGTNDAGEQLYERKDGSRYRMRNGKPDFGGDLSPVAGPVVVPGLQEIDKDKWMDAVDGRESAPPAESRRAQRAEKRGPAVRVAQLIDSMKGRQEFTKTFGTRLAEVKAHIESGKHDEFLFNKLENLSRDLMTDRYGPQSDLIDEIQAELFEGNAAVLPAEPKAPAMQEASKDDIAMLKKYGEPVASTMDALRRFSSGDRLFVIHEQDEKPMVVTSVTQLQGYTSEQIMALPQNFTIEGESTRVAGELPKPGALTQAMNDLAEVNARIESQGRVVDDRLLQRQRQLEAMVKELQGPETLSSAESKAQADLMAALGDLGDVLGKNTRANITPEQEQKLLPILTRLFDAAFRMGYVKFKQASRFVLKKIREALGDAVAKVISIDHLQGAYIGMAGKYGDKADKKRDVVAIETIEEIEADDQPEARPSNTLTPPTFDGQFLNMQLFTEAESKFVNDIMGRLHLSSDKPPLRNIVEARNLYAQITGEVPQGPAVKRVDELVELAVVLFAKDRINVARKDFKGKTPNQIAKAVYDVLVKVYQTRQPNLNFRTSTSIEQQAYSTPMPLAYIASRLAGVEAADKVYEPTAGNGMLLIEAAPENVIANELNPERNKALRVQDFGDVHGKDAMDMRLGEKVDVVIANPPFGVVRDGDGSRVFKAPTKQAPGGYYETTQIDHAISLKSLEFMKDDGRAVLIIGGPAKTAEGEAARSDAYNGKQKREFFLALYRDYNVVDHVTVSGDLYSKQGAAWPVDLIVIQGRGKSALPLPAAKPPRMIGDFNELGQLLGADGAQQRPPILGGDIRPPGSGTEPGGAPSPAGGQGATPAGSEPKPEGTQGDGGTRVPGVGRPDDGLGAGPGNGGVGVDGTTDGRGGAGNTGRNPRQDGKTDGERGGKTTPDGGNENTGGIPTNLDKPGGGTTTQGGSKLGQEQETSGQVTYVPGNDVSTVIGTLIPANMRTATQQALAALKEKVGPLEAYVAKELNYDVANIGDYFSAEQIDALALAIANVGKDAGFIIGDQTGIGKGRVNAGMIRWALINGKVPVFVTHKPNLYKDIYRDLADIGMPDIAGRLFMTNAGTSIPLEDEGPLAITTPESKKHSGAMERMMNDGELGQYDLILTTYDQMNLKAGVKTVRNRFLDVFVNGGMLILDESHNAGGSGVEKIGKGGQVLMDRATFVRELVQKASGVFYSSATYAKRPDVMDLYSKTDMKLSVPNLKKLGETILKGGVPLQQVVAAMLAKAGQYLRRERSFAGVTYDMDVVKVDKRVMEDASTVMREVIKFDALKAEAIKNLKTQIKGEGQAIGYDGSIGGAGAGSTNFTSIMHNLINQILLGMSVNATIEKVKVAVANDEKVVIALANTMESMLDRYVEENALHNGDLVNATFSDLFERYLERSREVTIKKPWKGPAETKRLTDEELGEVATAHFNATRDFIRRADWSSLPFSPIDFLHNELRKMGLKSAEITGRHLIIDYGGDKGPTLKSRPQKDINAKGRIKVVSDFNSGVVDVIVMNQAGSTGLSLHASPKNGKDIRKRRMIIAQPELNIDTYMQMLGRVHRTGQVVTPGYTQLVADVPAAKRPAAVLMKKMASLNANTTAARKSALTEDSKTPDFMNEYGDEVVANLMWDNPEIHQMLGSPLKEDENGGAFEKEDAARKVTGRIPVLPLRLATEIYEMIEEEYKNLLARKEAMGENALEAKTLELDAKTLESITVFESKGQDSPFSAGATASKMDIKRQGRPMTSAQVVQTASEHLGLNPSATSLDEVSMAGERRMDAQAREMRTEWEDWLDQELSVYDDPGKRSAAEGRHRAMFNKLDNMMRAFHIGQTVELIQPNGSVMAGVVVNFEKKGMAKNPAANGAWRVTVAVADAARQITLPVSQISVVGETGLVQMQYADTDTLGMPIIESFDHAQSQSREERVIVTGNLLAGFGKLARGQIINFTKADGSVEQGILMPKGYTLDMAQARASAEIESAEEALRIFNEGGTDLLFPDDNVRIQRMRGEIALTVPAAKAVGAKYFLRDELREIVGDFYKAGKNMVAKFDSDQLAAVLDVLYAKYPGLYMVKSAPKTSVRASMGTPRRELDRAFFRESTGPITIPAGTVMFHGAHKERAAEIEKSGKLLVKPSKKSGGGLLTEGGLIWFGDRDLAQGHADSEVDTIAAGDRFGQDGGRVFSVVTGRDFKLIDTGYQVTEDEAKRLDEALGVPSYKRSEEGDYLSSIISRAFDSSKKIERYETDRGNMAVVWPVALKLLGYDGFYGRYGVALYRDNDVTVTPDGQQPAVMLSTGTMPAPMVRKTDPRGKMRYANKEMAMGKAQVLNYISNTDGVRSVQFTVFDRMRQVDGVSQPVAHVVLEIARDGQIEALQSIEVKKAERRRGYGRWIVGNILNTMRPGTTLAVRGILSEAKEFWSSIGTRFNKDRYGQEHGTLKQSAADRNARRTPIRDGDVAQQDGGTGEADGQPVALRQEILDGDGKTVADGRLAIGAPRVIRNADALAEEVAKIAREIAPQANLKIIDQLFISDDESVRRSGGTPTEGGTEVAGAYTDIDNMMRVALGMDDPRVTVRHETVHHLKAMGLFTTQEWQVLEAQSRKSWMAQFAVPDAEEGIAYAYQGFKNGDAAPTGVIRRAFNKITHFLRRLGNALRGMGFQTWEDVFERVDAGTVGRRESDLVAASTGARTMASMGGFDVRDAHRLATNVRNHVADFLTTQRRFNRWWHTTVGTMYHLSTINPKFKRVFDIGQDYLTDFSRYASIAEEQAPDLLLRLESMRDVLPWKFEGMKVVLKGASKADKQAIAAPIFTGTLVDKVVYSKEELRRDFDLTDKQIEYYRQFREAVNTSLDELTKSTIARMVRAVGIKRDAIAMIRDLPLAEFHQEIAAMLRFRARELANLSKTGRADMALLQAKAMTAAKQIKATIRLYNKIAKLKAEGYAPLSRFGEHTVYVEDTNANGEKEGVFFSMYETEREANADARRLAELYPDATITQNVRAHLAHRDLHGLTPDTIRIFAEALELDKDEAFQEYIRLAVNSTSALKRLLPRKGIEGYSQDVSRVLASFVLSNSRLTSSNYHIGDLNQAVADINPQKDGGDVKDMAKSLAEYLQDPKEEAGKFRSYLFLQFLGGSIASALVNATQPITMTVPYLLQFSDTKTLATVMSKASLEAATGKPGIDVRAAYQRALDEGLIAPHEIHMLMAESGASMFNSGAARRFSKAWGSFFAIAEAFNRRSTFIAAYRIAVANEIPSPYEFARQAVAETQGIYNKGNRPKWARGPIGATIFTFKQFSIAYVEFLKRLPVKERAVALTILMLLAGISGLPFAEDIMDIIDTVMQWMGYSWNTKRELRKGTTAAVTALAEKLGQTEEVAAMMGKGIGQFILHGVSGIPGFPFDISARMGMHNLLPGSGSLKLSETDKERQILEVFGPAGSLVKSALDAATLAGQGKIGQAVETMLPVALQNAVKGVKMMITGQYKDRNGNKVMDVTPAEGLIKATGFNPQRIAAESRRVGESMQDTRLHESTERAIVQRIAAARVDGDAAAAKQAYDDRDAWNRKNPDMPIIISERQIRSKARQMRTDRAERTIKRAPKEMRQNVREAMQP